MPKQRITKEMVVDAAFEIARKDGIEKATVKTIAEKLGCSVQPIYSYCKNMDGLKNDVAEKARTFILAEVGKTVDRNDLFRSTGHAYIQIAKNEPHIFRMYLFQERKNVSSLDDITFAYSHIFPIPFYNRSRRSEMRKTDKQLEVKVNGTLDLSKVPEDLLHLFCGAMLDSILREEGTTEDVNVET